DTVDDDVAGIVLVEAADDVEHRRLAGARWAEDRDEFVVPERDGHIVEGQLGEGAGGVGLADVQELQQLWSLRSRSVSPVWRRPWARSWGSAGVAASVVALIQSRVAGVAGPGVAFGGQGMSLAARQACPNRLRGGTRGTGTPRLRRRRGRCRAAAPRGGVRGS